MKTASTGLQAYLASRPAQVICPDCFTVTLASGTQYFYTTADVPVTDEHGQVFAANSLRITGLKYKISIGLNVDEQTITVAATPTDTIQGVAALTAMREGVFDGAYLTRARCFLPAWGSPAIGSVILFHGRFSTIESIGRVEAQIKVKTDLVVLDREFPRNVYQRTCRWNLYGYGCGVNKATHGAACTIQSGATDQILVTNYSQPDQTASFGTVTFTSGVLNRDSLSVRDQTGGSLTLSQHIGTAPAIGDTLTVYHGCDHTTGSQGCAKFYNAAGVNAHFGGFPFVPQVQTGL